MVGRHAAIGHAADLRRDHPFALRSGSSEPGAFDGDAQLSGHATEVADDGGRRSFAAAAGIPTGQLDFVLFRVELDQVVLVASNDEKSAPVISSWRPGRGLTRTTRT